MPFDPTSLNPALDDVHHCPRCGAPDPQVDHPRSIRCGACGYLAYYNPKPVASAIPRTADGRIWLLKRGFDPGRGRWTFPGGFVDLGESVEDAAHRETREELDVAITLGPLVGIYSQPTDRVILIVYAARTDETPRTTPEATEVRAFAPDEVPWEDLAFWSTEQALRDLLDGPQGSTSPRRIA
ncbi:NUDIX domain-containing protein [Conexibacter sp. W3-3-2]|uniref:NUDIX hydrolase n=1 Tax=Conexibacter sp. W3-3-2 TaxID=2675227 RepID=UPI0012B9D18D|nr:NUDIX domain-containing protein [Conexibacter sp. W3-3-2]MTD46500.1 NUDIX domain-containing protein [Conexibacter sp. W3-3-2]